MKDTMDIEENVVKSKNKELSSILDAFDSLRNDDNSKIVGGAKIVSQLIRDENEKSIQYVLKRLVRSLGANIPDKRTGYFATLVSLLANITTISVRQLLDLVKSELHASGSSKSEVGDVALGHILVCGAIIRSKLILKCDVDEQHEVIRLILSAGTKKSYLSTVAYVILVGLCNELTEDEFKTTVWSIMKKDFKKSINELNLDSLYFLISVHLKYPQKIKLSKLIGVDDIVHKDTAQEIADILMTGLDFSSIGHPIYKNVGVLIAKSTPENIRLFWCRIDGLLVKHNRNKELAALTILKDILNNLNENYEVIPDFLSKNFFKLFMDWFKGLQTASKIRNKRDNEDDHKIMIKKQREILLILGQILSSEKIGSNVKIETLKKLLFYPGEMNFTEVTGTKITKLILTSLDENGVKKMAKMFKGVLLNTSKKLLDEGKERTWYNNEQVKAAELITHLVNHNSMKDDIEFKSKYMKLLMCYGFFKIRGDENISISSVLAGHVKSSFYRCFAGRFTNTDNLTQVLSSLCSFVNEALQKGEVKSKLDKQFPEENMECWQLVTEICDSIENNQSKSKVDKVFLILLYQLGLFLFSEPGRIKMARDSIKELKSCYEHYKTTQKKKLKKNAGDNLVDVPEWIEVLVEVLLSILSIESHALRSVVNCVFRLLCEHLTPSAVGQIVSVLDPDSESNPLTEGSDSESSDPEDSAEENEDEEKEDEDSDSEISEEDIDEDDAETKTPDQLRLAVQKALGAAADSDNESIDVDQITEEEGKKLDEALAEAFKQFHQGKGKKTKTERKNKKALSDFRIRVLDLIDIYLEKEQPMDICLGMVAPLLRALEFCIQDNDFKELEHRLRKTITNLTKIKKFSSIEDVNLDNLSDTLRSIITKGERSHLLFQALGDVITKYAIFIIYCSQKLDYGQTKSPKKKKSSSPLVTIFKECLESFFSNRTCLLPIIFFHRIFQMEWDGVYDIVPVIIENIFNQNVRQFRRTEGLSILLGFYKNRKKYKPSEENISKMNKIESEFQANLKKCLDNSNGFQFTDKYVAMLKNIVSQMQIYRKSCESDSGIDLDSLTSLIQSCKTHAQESKKNRQKPVKRKADEINGNVTPKKKKVKRKKNGVKTD